MSGLAVRRREPVGRTGISWTYPRPLGARLDAELEAMKRERQTTVEVQKELPPAAGH